MRIGVIAPLRAPLVEPFAGGAEARTHALVGELVARDHDVALYAAPGSDEALPVAPLPVGPRGHRLGVVAGADSRPDSELRLHHAYLSLMLRLAEGPRFDVVLNASGHYLPVAMAASLTTPVVSTLHASPSHLLESAITFAEDRACFVVSSRSAARAWGHVTHPVVIADGVQPEVFRAGPGGGPVVWSGRMEPAKAPHEAIEAARLAGTDLVLTGPVPDPAYFATRVHPLLGPDVRYAGHLAHAELARLLGEASVAVLTPSGGEPCALAAVEALACGTPVAAYARGALPEVVTPSVGELAPRGDTAALAAAIQLATWCDRPTVRRHAEQCLTLAGSVTRYEELFETLAGSRRPRRPPWPRRLSRPRAE